MDPKEGTIAQVIRARGHLGRNTEIGVSVPNTSLVNAEDGKVGGLYFGHVALVRDGQGAPLDVAQTGRVVFRRRGARTDIVGITCLLDVTSL